MAEQTSGPRTFDEWLAYQIQHRLRLAHMRSHDEQDWARSAWMARQPEIDALKADNERLRIDLDRVEDVLRADPDAVRLEQLTRAGLFASSKRVEAEAERDQLRRENDALRQRIAELEGR